MTYLTDEDREAIAPREHCINAAGQSSARVRTDSEVYAAVESLIRAHRAATLRKAASEIDALDPPEYLDAPQYREGRIDGHGLSAALCRSLAARIEKGNDDD